jgi:hypothetical protein
MQRLGNPHFEEKKKLRFFSEDLVRMSATDRTWNQESKECHATMFAMKVEKVP